MLNALKNKIFCVRGNCDTEVDQMVLQFPVLADYAVLQAGDRLIYATHGHVHNMQNVPFLQPGDILLHGHTHVPAWTPFGDHNLYLNPGSLSLPKQNSPHSYMTLEDGVFVACIMRCVYRARRERVRHGLRRGGRMLGGAMSGGSMPARIAARRTDVWWRDEWRLDAGADFT